jgi:phage repressor protein C with HTH and peptisase S24 domain
LQALAINSEARSFRRMTMTVDPRIAEQRLTGQAFKALRERRGKFQKNIADALGLTTQAWQKYEAGERRWNPETIETALLALGVGREALDAERSKILGLPPRRQSAGFSDRGSEYTVDVVGKVRAGASGIQIFNDGEPLRQVDLRSLFGPESDAMEVAGDSVSPWANSGEIVIFDRGRFPRPGAGCVVETVEGGLLLKFYEKSDGSTLFLKELVPVERIIQIPMRDVKGIYAVRLRGD